MSKASSAHTYNYIANDEQTRISPRRFVLRARQQPIQTRISTNNERDRRTLDPPPIIQIRLQDALPQETQNFLQAPSFFMCANLAHWSDDNEIYTPNHNALSGQAVSSLYKLKDIDNNDGGFFIFGDLSVKVEGRFRLKFTLFEITASGANASVAMFSEIFTVYSARSFSGMLDSTFLSRTFSDQGARIRIRKEHRSQLSGSRKRKHSIQNLSVSPPPTEAHSLTPSSWYPSTDDSTCPQKSASKFRRLDQDTGFPVVDTHVSVQGSYSLDDQSPLYTPTGYSGWRSQSGRPPMVDTHQDVPMPIHSRRDSMSSNSGTESTCSEPSSASMHHLTPSHPLTKPSFVPLCTTKFISPQQQMCNEFGFVQRGLEHPFSRATFVQSEHNKRESPGSQTPTLSPSLNKRAFYDNEDTHMVQLPPLRYIIPDNHYPCPSIFDKDEVVKTNAAKAMVQLSSHFNIAQTPQPIHPTSHTHTNYYATLSPTF